MAETTANIEKALVGAIILSQKHMVQVMETVKPTDFASEQAMVAFSAAAGLWQKRQTVDLVSVAAVVPHLTAYLAEATSDCFAPNATGYAYTIARKARDRRVKSFLEVAAKSQEDTDTLLGKVLEIYQREMSAGSKDPSIYKVLERVDAMISSIKQRGSLGFLTGFGALDSKWIRYSPGHIWTVGGFTSSGKTATMIQSVANLIYLGETPRIALISTEMTEAQLISRLVANLTGAPSYRVLSGNFRDEEEADKVAACKDALKKYPLTIYDDIYTIREIEMAFRKMDLQGGVDIGWIDYVQNCRMPEAKSQYQEQSEMAKNLQKLAKDVNATLICLSQVSNDVARGNTDNLELKGAGEWAAVSDIGVMLARHKTEKHRLKLQVKKNRHGPLVDMELEYANDWTRLDEKQTC